MLSDRFICPSISKHALIYDSLSVFAKRLEHFYDYDDVNFDSIQQKRHTFDVTSMCCTSNMDVQLSIFNEVLTYIHSNDGLRILFR